METDFKNLVVPGVEKQETEHVLMCNEESARYNLSLTKEQVHELIVSRREALKDLEILEFNEGILPQLVKAFADSPYVFQDTYTQTLDELQYLFYRFRRGSDEEMLELMRKTYDNVCQGSIELLIQYFENLEQEDRKKGIKTMDFLEPDEEYIDFADGTYSFTQMLPVLMKLSKMYVDGTSLSYNKARQLMSAVSFCIKKGISADTTPVTDKLPDAMTMYNAGKNVLREQHKYIKTLASKLSGVFFDYGIRYVRHGVYEDIIADIEKTDLIFSPHMLYKEPEYTMLGDISSLYGTDRLEGYIKCAITEWTFLSKFDTAAVTELLERTSKNYRETFFDNICETVLQQAVGCMAADVPAQQLYIEKEDADMVRLYFSGEDIDGIRKHVKKLAAQIIDEKDMPYYENAFNNIASRINSSMKNNSIEQMFCDCREVSYGGKI